MTVTHTISKTRAKVGETVTVSTSEIQAAASGVMWVINYTSSDGQYSFNRLIESGRGFANYTSNLIIGTKSVTISYSHLDIKTLTPIYWAIPAAQANYLNIALNNPIENNEFVTIGETIDVSFYINLAESVYSLGEKLATNISEKGVSASADDGLTTLANKIDDIYENIPRVIIEDDTVTDFADLRFTVITPANCLKLKINSFTGCNNLVCCIIQEGPTFLESSAFSNCSNLQIVELPSTIRSLGAYVFSNLPSLHTLTFKSLNPPALYNSGQFNSLPTTCTIRVPQASLSLYESATGYPDPTTYTYVGY